MNGIVEKAREAVKSAARMASPAIDRANPTRVNTNRVDTRRSATSGLDAGPNKMPNMLPEETNRLAFGDDSVLLDPELIKAARHIYRTFYEVHPEVMQRPIGVAIGRLNRRGKLVFGDKPVLLPQECFVPFSQIEPGLA